MTENQEKSCGKKIAATFFETVQTVLTIKDEMWHIYVKQNNGHKITESSSVKAIDICN